MRPLTALAVIAAAVLTSVVIWLATGGRFAFFFLPLLLGLPLLGRGRR